jgi:hypothetical protein
VNADARSAAWPRPSPLEWAYLAIGLALVLRYRWLMDDAFVYFRYVDNLLFLKVGLVYNAGEYVEGFSSPLHALLLVALRALELGWPTIVTGVGCAAFIAFWAGMVALNRALSPNEAVVLNLPLAYLVANYGLTSFFTSGLETPLAHVMAPALGLFLLHPGSRALAGLLALAPLARPELALAVGLAGAFVWWRRRAFPWWLFGASLAANGAWLAFRIYYYADLLPNTFHLKDGVRFGQGARYLLDTAATYHAVGFAAVVVGAALWVRSRAPRGRAFDFRSPERFAMLVIAAAVATYVARVGGSHVHYWYLAFAFSLAVAASGGVAEAALRTLAPGRARIVGPAIMLGVTLSVFFLTPSQLTGHPFFGEAEHTSLHFIDDADWHRRHPSLAFDRFGERAAPDALRAAGRRLAADGYAATRAGTWCRRQYAGMLERWVHGFGLTDALLARTEAGWLKPGHKTPLIPLSKDIARIERASASIGPGLYRRAVDTGRAPAWVAANLDAIETIERRIYNRHDFAENLALALHPPPRIALPGASQAPRAPGPVDAESAPD